MRYFLGAVCAALLVVGCQTLTVSVERPEGFAEFSNERTDRASYRAVSPEGVVLQVRFVANDPPKDLSFWRETLQHHLQQEGYILLERQGEDGAITTPAGDGTILEWVAPVGDADFVYLTALVVSGDSIIVAEAAGEHSIYEEYRDVLLQSLSTITVP